MKFSWTFDKTYHPTLNCYKLKWEDYTLNLLIIPKPAFTSWSQQWKHLVSIWKLKMLFRRLHYYIWTYSTHSSGLFVAEFEQVNVSWVNVIKNKANFHNEKLQSLLTSLFQCPNTREFPTFNLEPYCDIRNFEHKSKKPWRHYSKYLLSSLIAGFALLLLTFANKTFPRYKSSFKHNWCHQAKMNVE